MSTFDGRIKEYPSLAIDNFVPNNYTKHFVLSHVHKGKQNTAFSLSNLVYTLIPFS
jgi:hypothetical protein